MVQRTHRTAKQILGPAFIWHCLCYLKADGGFANSQLKNLRTEIVLRDASDVAFWFSFSFRVATTWQHETGKRAIPVSHQTRARPKALFPKRREQGEQINSGEDEATGEV
jgi:hypothetical protein